VSANKTVETRASVKDFIDSVSDESRKRDSLEMLRVMNEITGQPPRMWGGSLVGFGSYHYRYESGREGDFFLTGFSPRKNTFTVYIMPGFSRFSDHLARLGPHRTGKSCLYLKNLDSIDRDVLRQLISDSVAQMRKTHDCR